MWCTRTHPARGGRLPEGEIQKGGAGAAAWRAGSCRPGSGAPGHCVSAQGCTQEADLPRYCLGLSSRLAGFDKCRGRAPRGARPLATPQKRSVTRGRGMPRRRPGVPRHGTPGCGVPHQRLSALRPLVGGRTRKRSRHRKGRKRPAGTAELCCSATANRRRCRGWRDGGRVSV